ncbi:MAG: gramicidin dehydrogenase [Myxococcales bacterium]|nr:gramicidin dehydrogenase [Myxococcales bacterium]
MVEVRIAIVYNRDVSEQWLPRRRLPDATPVVCFPAAGSTAAAFSEWKPFAAPDLELVPIKLPGRGVRLAEPPVETMPELVARIGEAIGPMLPARYGVFGQCLGAVLAFEVTRWLIASRWPRPAHLLVAGCGAPATEKVTTVASSDDEAKLIEQLRAWGGTPESALARRDFLDLLVPPLRSDLRLFEAYRATEQPPIDVPITAFRGRDDAFVSADAVVAWRDYTTAAFATRELPGGHFADPAHLVPALRGALA